VSIGINRSIFGYPESEGDDYLTGREIRAKIDAHERELAKRAYPLVRPVPCAVYLNGLLVGEDQIETDEEMVYGLGCAGRSPAKDVARLVFERAGLELSEVARYRDKLEVRYGRSGVQLIPDGGGIFEERSLAPIDLEYQKKQRQDVDDALAEMREAARERRAERE
jgi:hypothetical protein